MSWSVRSGRWPTLPFILVFLVALAGGPVVAKGGDDRLLTVMTRNVYVGTDLNAVFGATNPPALFAGVATDYAEVVATDFPERAEALADEIEATQPDLIGLQEVSLFRSDFPPDGPATPATVVEYDYLALLLGALAARDLHYGVVAVSTGIDAELPHGFPPTRDIRLTDRDVLLARMDLPTSALKLSNAQAGSFVAIASTPSAVGPIAIPRGWVSVDVKVRGIKFRVISTHLETETYPAVQAVQAAELMAGPGNTSLPLVLLGDLNSRADGTGTATYGNLIAGGLVDAWSQAHPGDPGYTFGHDPDLLNPLPDLDERIDLVLVRGGFVGLDAEILGESPADRTPSGLWPSDHAGVVATLCVAKSAHGCS